MRYEQQKVLLAWARLQLQIAQARNPQLEVDVTDATITKSLGYRKLRQWFTTISPAARSRAIKWMSTHLDGVRDVIRKAKATGEELTLADIEIDYIDASTGEQLAPLKIDTNPEPLEGGEAKE